MNAEINNEIKKRRFEDEFNKECENTYMLIDDEESRTWYSYATTALMFASPVSLQINMGAYPRLFEIVDGGINLNIVAILCNNLERVTPYQLKITTSEYQKVMKLNLNIANYWKTATAPIAEKVKLRLRLSNNLTVN